MIVDLFAGTGSSTAAWDGVLPIYKVELDEQFEADWRDIWTFDAIAFVQKYGNPVFVWASPPCTTFSVASIGHHWNRDRSPKTAQANQGIALLNRTIEVIEQLNPIKGFVIENPRGMMRKMPQMERFNRQTVSYCAYGDTRQKPTDLWSNFKWDSRPMCKRGSGCHQAAPRESSSGTQGIKGAKERSKVPLQLSLEIKNAVMNRGFDV